MNEHIALIVDSYPDLKIKSFELVEKGWDSLVAVVNKKYIFRFPRREDSWISLEREIVVLPLLRKMVGVAIPDFKFFAKRMDDFPKSFVGYEMIVGSEFTGEVYKRVVAAGKLEEIGKKLGEFLTGLHQFPLAKARELEVEGRGSEKWWVDYYGEVKRKAWPLMSEKQRDWTQGLFESFIGDKNNFNFREVLLHADLGASHIIVDQKKLTLSGVIDFGDLAMGDYAFDLYGIHREYGQEFLDLVIKYYEGKNR